MNLTHNQEKVSILPTPFFQQQHSYFQQKRNNQRIRRIHRRRLLVIGIFFSVVFLLLGFQIFKTQRLTANIVQEKDISQQRLEKVTGQRKELKQQVKQLQDADYLQKLIREKYYYSKNGETIYNLPSEN
jgi:cell division protein DivIC